MADEPQGPTPPSSGEGTPSPWALAGLGTQFFLSVLLFMYAGNWMDARLGTSPLLVLLGVIGGGGGSFYLSYRRLMRKVKSKDSTSDRKGPPAR